MKGQEKPAEILGTTRSDRCEGSGAMLVHGRCAVCHQMIRPRSSGGAAIHGEPAWLKERRARSPVSFYQQV